MQNSCDVVRVMAQGTFGASNASIAATFVPTIQRNGSTIVSQSMTESISSTTTQYIYTLTTFDAPAGASPTYTYINGSGASNSAIINGSMTLEELFI
jgi:hypothetical protein